MVTLLTAHVAVTTLLAVLLVLVIAVQRLARVHLRILVQHLLECRKRDVPVPAEQRARALTDHR